MCDKCVSEPVQIELELKEEEPTTFKCGYCDNDCELGDKYDGINPDHELICEDCHNDNYGYCESCDTCVDINDLVMASGDSNAPRNSVLRHEHSICSGCVDSHYSTCSDCSDLVHDSLSHSVGDSQVCTSCYSENYFNCDNCGENLHNDDYCGDGQCNNCYTDDDDVDGLHDYGYTPTLKFRGIRKGLTFGEFYPETFIGVELEVESARSSQSSICDNAYDIMGNDSVYCKSDGSLNNGVEIVSHPYAIKAFPFDKLRVLCAKLLESGARSYEPGTCGLHVHVSRTGLKNSDNREKLERILWKGMLLLKPFLMPLSKRGDKFTYCNFPEVGGERLMRERYSAINFQNQHTVEVRFFRGTLHAESCVNSIKFAYHLVKFISECSESHLDNLIKKNKGAQLWFSLLNSMPSHLRGWAISRSKTAVIVECEERATKERVNKTRKTYQINEEGERLEQCA